MKFNVDLAILVLFLVFFFRIGWEEGGDECNGRLESSYFDNWVGRNGVDSDRQRWTRCLGLLMVEILGVKTAFYLFILCNCLGNC